MLHSRGAPAASSNKQQKTKLSAATRYSVRKELQRKEGTGSRVQGGRNNIKKEQGERERERERKEKRREGAGAVQ